MENEEGRNNTINLRISKTFVYVVLAMVVGFGGGFGMVTLFINSAPDPDPVSEQSASQQGSSAVGPVVSQQALPFQISTEGRPFLGPEDAPVTIVEFTDYECPFCGRHFRETLPKLLRQYEGQIKYVSLNFPLGRIHPYAPKAAEAAECAFDQGRFWEYHDLLFQSQDALDLGSLKGYAQDIGLDANAFGICLDSGIKSQQILRDVEDGRRHGVTGTPFFFINGDGLAGAQHLTAFETAIDAALGK